MRRRGTARGVGVMLAAVATSGFAACGGSAKSANQSTTHQAAQKAAKQAQAEYHKCNSQLSSLLSAEENLNSHLDIGMNFTDYTQAVGNVKAAYDQTPIHQMAPKCLLVGVSIENALNDYAHAVNTWNNCISNLASGCTDSSIKPQLQGDWSKASSQINQAKGLLGALQSGNAPTAASAVPSTAPVTSTTSSSQTGPPAPSDSQLNRGLKNGQDCTYHGVLDSGTMYHGKCVP